jgi:hypothetical protein
MDKKHDKTQKQLVNSKRIERNIRMKPRIEINEIKKTVQDVKYKDIERLKNNNKWKPWK